MAQSARTDNAKPAEQAKERVRETNDQLARLAHEGERVAKDVTESANDAGRTLVATTRQETARTVEASSQAAKDVASRSAETLRQSTEAAGKTASAAMNGQAELMRSFMELASEQLRHNLETARRFAGVRDWTEASELQHRYMIDSLNRFSVGMARCFELTRSLTGKLGETGRAQPRAG